MTHQGIFKKFAEKLNKENIEFFIIRGFQHLPEKPDTDLDIVIRDGQFKKTIDIARHMPMIPKPKLTRRFGFAEYCDMLYHPFFTKGPRDPLLAPNFCFRLDLYNSMYFKSPLNDYKTFWTVPFDYQEKVFRDKVKKNFYFIPSLADEVALTIMRATLDKQIWKEKYKNRINEILRTTDQKQIIEAISMVLPDAKGLYDKMIDNKYEEIKWD